MVNENLCQCQNCGKIQKASLRFLCQDCRSTELKNLGTLWKQRYDVPIKEGKREVDNG